MAKILTWVHEPQVSTRFTIVSECQPALKMWVRDSVTRTIYCVLFYTDAEYDHFLNANDEQRAKLVKNFEG